MSIAARRMTRRSSVFPPDAVTRTSYGVMPWGNPYSGTMTTNAAALLGEDWVGGLSAFCRWQHVTNNGTSWNFAPFDRISEAANVAKKPWMLMVILGSKDNGIPDYVINQVPSSDWIFTDGYEFPVFWSTKANQLRRELFQRIADRYNNDPWLVSVRMTSFWSTHGEPWFAGGSTGKSKWVSAWNATGHSGDLSAVQAAYQQHEKDKWSEMMSMFKPNIAIAQAAGDALYDIDGSIEQTLPARHPDRLSTWTWLREQYGSRTTLQFNGVNAGVGASGYGKWLPNSFGPYAPVPAQRQGRIGSQPVAGAGTTRLPYDNFVTMIRNLTAWQYSYCEVYYTDAWFARSGETTDARKICDVMIEQKDNWARV